MTAFKKKKKFLQMTMSCEKGTNLMNSFLKFMIYHLNE